MQKNEKEMPKGENDGAESLSFDSTFRSLLLIVVSQDYSHSIVAGGFEEMS